jgi:hypothetical protein
MFTTPPLRPLGLVFGEKYAAYRGRVGHLLAGVLVAEVLVPVVRVDTLAPLFLLVLQIVQLVRGSRCSRHREFAPLQRPRYRRRRLGEAAEPCSAQRRLAARGGF